MTQPAERSGGSVAKKRRDYLLTLVVYRCAAFAGPAMIVYCAFVVCIQFQSRIAYCMVKSTAPDLVQPAIDWYQRLSGPFFSVHNWLTPWGSLSCLVGVMAFTTWLSRRMDTRLKALRCPESGQEGGQPVSEVVPASTYPPLHARSELRRTARHRYIRSMARATTIGVGTAVAAVTVGSVAVYLPLSVITQVTSAQMLYWYFGTLPLFTGLGLAVSTIAFRLFQATLSSIKEVRALPYVPPVQEHLAALPAEEVLLRGAEQPAAAPEQLLRAAHKGDRTETAELLRAASGGAGREGPT
jgi:hypothetical protein